MKNVLHNEKCTCLNLNIDYSPISINNININLGIVPKCQTSQFHYCKQKIFPHSIDTNDSAINNT